MKRFPIALALLISPLLHAQDSGKSVSPELQAKINKAIDKGCKFIQNRYNAQAGAGQRAMEDKRPLMAYAMLKSGVPAKDAKIQSAKREAIAATGGKLQTMDRFSQMYLAGIMGMLLSEFDDAESKAALQKLADLIASAQAGDGAWGYAVGKPENATNASTTQYALLGLQAAANKGCKVSPAVFERAAQYFVGGQESGGGIATGGSAAAGWPYHHLGKEGAYGSMTAVGIASLVICDVNLGAQHNLHARMLESITKGISWMGKNFTVSDHPGKKPWKNHRDTLWLYYYLYSMERAGVFAKTETMGTHSWYAEGAEFLVKKQSADGSWDETHEKHEDDDIATCFALLFLARASEKIIPTGASSK